LEPPELEPPELEPPEVEPHLSLYLVHSACSASHVSVWAEAAGLGQLHMHWFCALHSPFAVEEAEENTCMLAGPPDLKDCCQQYRGA